MCSNEIFCHGYVMIENTPNYCQLATSSDKCPPNCRGPFQIGNVQPLDPDAQCGSEGKWNGGCFIKTGKKLYAISFQILLKLSF